VNIETGKARGLIREAVEEGLPPYEIFMEGVAKGMDVVGRRYETGEYFLTELLGAAQVANEAMEELGPYLQVEPVQCVGKVVIGTVQGDIHDIGKNIVKMLMTSSGFEVYDLGTDVSPDKFVQKVRETKADIVAISSLLTTTMNEMSEVVKELEKSNLRLEVKVIIGGAPITDEFAAEIGADAAARDAGHGLRLCKEWMGSLE
jgi:5-methyltetrahydrofolate--homocysteine methyltransferase